MKQFHFLTIFPEAFDSYLSASILKRAQDSRAVSFHVHNLRDWTTDKHSSVDDTPYGGGAGMVMKVEPFYAAVRDILTQTGTAVPEMGEPLNKRDDSTCVVLLSAKGETFAQQTARTFATEYDTYIFLCGRYEGVDERVREHVADEEISIGDYVLTGGELGSMVVADAVTRLVPGVLGNDDSATHESHEEPGVREHPHYTKPEEFNGWRVPDVLMSGNHEEIAKWRKQNQK